MVPGPNFPDRRLILHVFAGSNAIPYFCFKSPNLHSEPLYAISPVASSKIRAQFSSILMLQSSLESTTVPMIAFMLQNNTETEFDAAFVFLFHCNS